MNDKALFEKVVLRDVLAAVRPDLFCREGVELYLTQRGVPTRYAENFLRMFTTEPEFVIDHVLGQEDLQRAVSQLRLWCDFQAERGAP
ncbi:hypothetical protein ACP6C7_03800 [Mycolicibacterium septicum]|uniref:Uncharacterized protein n=1 Tax=Mycolicibacterium septicum TaxID=98668 RepID=A0ABW9LNX7_9MYCO